MKLLIVDADRHQVEMLASWLKTQGYEVYRSYTGEHARQEWRQRQPDLVVIDPVLSDMDGLALCREMRARHDALVMVMMDGKDVHDEIRCLESGADDYLSKPFFPAQFLAHLRSLSRRGRSALIQQPSVVVVVGPMRIDYLQNEVTIDKRSLRLTPIESKLLHLLAINMNAVCTTSQIVSYIWGLGNAGDSGLIKAHIRHLRQKIEYDPGRPRYILTVPGVGYKLVYYQEKEETHAAQELVPVLGLASF